MAFEYLTNKTPHEFVQWSSLSETECRDCTFHRDHKIHKIHSSQENQ